VTGSFRVAIFPDKSVSLREEIDQKKLRSILRLPVREKNNFFERVFLS
jgi:hypothetical protein